MITQKQLGQVISAYDKNKLTIGTLGGHSALDICRGAKDEGLKTLVVCQKGREKTYTQHYASRNGKGIVDETIVLDKFTDITKPEIQEKLRKMNTVFVHSRYFWVYCDIGKIENEFRVPIFGTRELVRKEERNEERNQYFLLEEAGIKTPKKFSKTEEINMPV